MLNYDQKESAPQLAGEDGTAGLGRLVQGAVQDANILPERAEEQFQEVLDSFKSSVTGYKKVAHQTTKAPFESILMKRR